MSETSAAPAPATPTTSSENDTTQTSQTPQSQTAQPPVVPTKKKFKYKADDKEIEEELDDNEIASRLSLAKAATKRMQEASLTKKQVENFIKELKENPLKVLNDDRVMGSKKFRELAESYLVEELKREQMTPEQRASLERDQELERYKAEEKLRREEEERSKATQLEQQYVAKFEKTIIDALEASKLPKTPGTVASMARLLQMSLKSGIEADTAQLVSMVKEERQGELKALINGMSAEDILSWFGDEISNKIRKHDLSKFQIKNPAPAKPTQKPETTPVAQRMSPREFDEQLRKRFQK